MKQLAKYFMIAAMLCFSGINIGSPADVDGFEVTKGQVLDLDGDKWWDELSFQVETKSANFQIPVLAVKLVGLQQGESIFLNFEKIEVNKKISNYTVDLEGFKLNQNFSIEIVLDTSALSDYEILQMVDGGPGSNPNETVIIIEFP